MAANQSDGRSVTLSIILPCLNEASTLGDCIADAKAGLLALAISAEIIVADNGSSDDSVAIARRCGVRVVQVPRRGYGAALAAGISAATGQFVLIADADRSYDLTNLIPFWALLLAGDQLVIGNRFTGEIRAGAMPILNKLVGNPVLSAIGRHLFKADVGDFHCGIRAARREAIQALDLRAPGMEYATEMIARAAQANLRIGQTPIVLSVAQRPRKPHLRPWRDGIRHLRLMLELHCARRAPNTAVPSS